jgi:catalase
MSKQLFTEYPEQDERKYYELLADKVRSRMDDLYKDSERALRDTHSKTHAAVKGTLEIFDFEEEAIKRELSKYSSLTPQQLNAISIKQGLLAQPKQYPVWLRFANGRTEVNNDYVSDTRSMTIKVMGVEGQRLEQSHESKTQDIVVQNAEVFFIQTIKYYYSFFCASTVSKKAVFTWLLQHPFQFYLLTKYTNPTPKSLLTERYWSGSAFALGLNPDVDPSQASITPVKYPAVIKYAFTPVESEPPHHRIPFQSRPGIPKFPFSDRAKALGLDSSQPDNYYRDGLIQSLADSNAQYSWDFGIQFQTIPNMSIDDPTVIWHETASPFFTVGRLTVNHQVINWERQYDFSENLRFSPWNGLAVHRPVGAINRLRSIVYPIVGSYRLQKRGLVYQEPTGSETF